MSETCVHCGETVEDEAVMCPSCGFNARIKTVPIDESSSTYDRTGSGHDLPNTSGQGKQAAIPPEIDRWNWGAFLAGGIWGLGNRVYISLLGIVPGVGIVMPFVLGAMGSVWAWRKKRWSSVEHFKRVQRRWALWSAGVYGVGIAVAIVVVVTEDPPGPAEARSSVRSGDVLVSDDGRFQINVPSSWAEEPDLNADAVLQAGHRFEELYVVVLSESKQDLASNLSLREYARAALRGMRSGVENPRLLQGATRVATNGGPAVQHVLEGDVDELRIVYVHTAAEISDGFVQIIAWTLPSELDAKRVILEEVTRSFKEV